MTTKVVDTQWANEHKFLTSLMKDKNTAVSVVDGLDILSPKLGSGHYYKEKVAKKKIVLHYTVGDCKSAYNTLTDQSQKVSVSYLVSREGKVICLFDDAYWSYHLGAGAVGGNKAMSSESIGIEIANFGPLTRNGYELHTCYSTDKKPQVYCDIGDTNNYIYLKNGFKGYNYFAKPTHEQLEAVEKLVRWLCGKHSIPVAQLADKERYEVFADATAAKRFSGICTHINFRKDGKWDIEPMFFDT